MRKVRDLKELERYRKTDKYHRIGGAAAYKKSSGIKVSAVLKVILAAVCGFLIFTFIFTMFCGIVNAANITGIVLCGAVILLIVFSPLSKKNAALRRISIIAAVLLCLFTVYSIVISCFIVSGMLNKPEFEPCTESAPPTHTVIVLGCKTINGYPSPMLAARLQRALEYEKEHKDTAIIVSGGKGMNETEAEADTMYRYLTTHGIDGSKIYKEDRSSDTWQNILYSKSVIQLEKLPETVVIVSECYHVYRGTRNARKEGLEAFAVYSDPSPFILTLPTYWLREIFALSRDYASDILVKLLPFNTFSSSKN